MKTLNIKIYISLVLIIFSLNLDAIADNDIEVDIKSINQLEKMYKPSQKIQLHLDLAKIYAENNRWWKYYKHLRSIFNACPAIKGAKIIMINGENQQETEKKPLPIDPYIIKRLKKLGIIGVNNKKQAIEYLDLLKPICDVKCVKPNSNNFLKEE